MAENPLVTVLVITYNSSKYVLETLESVKAQTYKNLELIISDDCSSDNTISVCEEWLNSKKNLSFNYRIITTNQNTGTPRNCNRGLNAATGKWVKLIAGDDVLKNDCIKQNFEHAEKSVNDIALVVSYYSRFKVEDNIKKKINGISFSESIVKRINNSSKKQKTLDLIQSKYNFPGCVFFFHRKKILEVGGFDEDFKRIEDLPLLFRILEKYQFNILPVETINYRLESSSATQKISKEYIKDSEIMYNKYYFGNLKWYNFLTYWDIFIKKSVNKLKFEKSSKLEFKWIMVLSPSFIIKILKTKLSKKNKN
jgi:glycosyltransferase involved in cell wall biosynthesis